MTLAPGDAVSYEAGTSVTTRNVADVETTVLLAVHAVFTLPAERVRGCGRCGWLFLDSSRGGRRRWCSMSTCGNREKASRHRHAAHRA